MNSFKLSQVLPCASFFAEGRVFAGTIALLMQSSLILWPAAARWAQVTDDQSGVEKMLAELSETHRAQVSPYPAPTKKFRPLT